MKEKIKEAINDSIYKVSTMKIIDEVGKPVFYSEPHFQYVMSYFLAQEFGFNNVFIEFPDKLKKKVSKQFRPLDILVMANEKYYPIELKYSYKKEFGTSYDNIVKNTEQIIESLCMDVSKDCDLPGLSYDIYKIRHLIENNSDKINTGYCIFLADKEREKIFNDLCEKCVNIKDVSIETIKELPDFSCLLIELQK